MRYQNKWKLFLEQTLLEGRNQTKQAKKDFPLMSDIIDYLLEKDETPEHFVEKYTLWLAQKLKEKIDQIYDSEGLRVPEGDQYDPVNHKKIMEKLVTAINEYYKVEQKLKKTKPNVEGKNGYQSIDDFIDAVAQASEGRKDTEGYKKYIERASQIEGDIIYNNPKELIVATIADNFEESCDLGYPAWCVSLPSTQGAHYDSYKNRGNRIYFIHHFFIPKAKIGSEPFSKTAIQKELRGKTTLWDERDNPRDLNEYKSWLKEKLGDEKGEAIFNEINTAIERDWEKNAKPAKYILDDRGIGDIEREIKYNITELLKRTRYHDIDKYPPLFNFRRFLPKREFERDDFFRNLRGDWLVNLGKLNLSFDLTYESMGMDEYVISQISNEIENSIYDNLQDEIKDFEFPTVGIGTSIEDDGVNMNFEFNIYAYLLHQLGGKRELVPAGLGNQTVEDKTLITRAIPNYLSRANTVIFDTVKNNRRKKDSTLSENKLNRIIIRVG